MDVNIKIKHINLLVANRCNLKCKMCDYQWAASKKRELTLDEIIHLIDGAVEVGLERIELSGGEPMEREDIYRIIGYAKSLNLRTLLITNGTLIGDMEAKRLIESGISGVIISLEGNDTINDSIRGKGNYGKALCAVQSLLKYESQLDYINISITVSKANYKSLYDFTEYLVEQVGVKGISYNPFDRNMLNDKNYSNVKNFFEITPDLCFDLSQELEKIIKYGTDKKINLSPDYYLRKIPDYFEGKVVKPLFPCCEPLTGCSIDSSGDLFACWGQSDRPIGNITVSSFKELVNSINYKEACKKGLTLKCKGCLKACYVNIHNNVF